jgi:F-type H+-transporting ATPase subunit a
MEEHVLGITRFVNHLLGPLAAALLSKLHITPNDPELPIPQHVVMGVLVVLVGTVLALILKSRLSVEKPGAFQQAAELIPFVGSISIFVLLSNLLGAFPNSFLVAPTGQVTVPLACAILTFLYFNWQGIKHHGPVGYLGTFAGSPKNIGAWALAILLFPVEIISTCARLLSLTVRLWANMFASDLIYVIFLSLLAGGASFGWSKHPILGVVLGVFPALIPVAFIGLHIFVAVVQAYVFTVLPSVYLGMATADEH